MTNDQRRLVLIVDTDHRFVDDARPLLTAHRVLTARGVDEALEIVLGGRVDLVLLGPAFGSAAAVSQARVLLDADPSLQIGLAADVVTNRLLKAALKGGFVDVLDLPLSERDLDDVLRNLRSPAPQPTELKFVVEPVGPAPSATTAVATDVETPESTDVLSAPEVLTEDIVPVSEVPAAPIASVPASEPLSISTPTKVWFEAAPVAVTEVEEVAPPVLVDDASPEPQTTEPVAPAFDSALADEDMPPAWPLEDADLPPFEAPRSETSPEVPEASEETAPMPPSIPDVLDQVLPPPARNPQEEPPPAHRSARSRSWRGSRVIAVMAGKGGSGKTITVTNLAFALGLHTDPERVAIVDTDLQFGDVALMLQMEPVLTLGDLADGVESLSDEEVDSALLRHDSGMRVLAAPVNPAGAGGISAKSVVEVVNRLRSMFDTVVIDTGPVFDDFLVTVLESADDVIIVVDMDLPSVKNAQVALDGLRQVEFDMSRIRLVMNRANSKVRLDLDEVETSLGFRISGSIPSDRLIPQGVNGGVPAIASSPRSKVARAFQDLAESLESTGDRGRITDQ